MASNSNNVISKPGNGLGVQSEVVDPVGHPYSTLAGVGVDIRRIVYENALFVRDPMTLTTFTEGGETYSNCILLDFSNVCTALFRLNEQISRESREYFYTKNHLVHVLTNPTIV
jgi:hypothetical protein